MTATLKKFLGPVHFGGNVVTGAAPGFASSDLATVGQTSAVLNVMSKGADRTGTADSTSAAQSAITAMSAFGGGDVYFPYGSWKLTPPSTTVPALTVPSNIRLVGDGMGATTLEKSGNGPLIDFSGSGPVSQGGTVSENQGLRSLAINGNGYTGLLLRLYYVQAYYEQDVQLFGNGDVSVDMAQLWDSRITNGMYLYGGSASLSAISGGQAVAHLIRNSAAPATTLSAGISGTITALPVAALTAAMPAGIVQVWNGSGQLQNFTTTGAASGATSIPVTSAVVAHTYVTGNAVNGFGWSGDNTNATTFIGCHWENNVSGAFWVKPGVNNTNSPNQIYFLASKVEEDLIGYNCPQIEIDPGCTEIHIDHLYFYAGNFNSGYSTPVVGIKFNPDVGTFMNVDMFNGGVATISTGLDVSTSSGYRLICTNIMQNWNTSPTGPAFNTSSGTPFLTNFQISGTVSNGFFVGDYSLINDSNGSWSFFGVGAIGTVYQYGPLVMTGQTVPPATSGASTIYSDSNGALTILDPSGLSSLVQQSQPAATSAVTVANTTTLTQIAGLSVPTAQPVAGSRYKITAFGQFGTTSSAPTLTLGLYWGGVTGTTLTTILTGTGGNAPGLAVSLSGAPFLIEGEIYFRTATTVTGWLKVTYGNSTTATTAQVVVTATIVTPVTVVTTSAKVLALGWKWGTANSGNTVNIASSAVEKVS